MHVICALMTAYRLWHRSTWIARDFRVAEESSDAFDCWQFFVIRPISFERFELLLPYLMDINKNNPKI
jgi:hypothetical protein